MWLPPRRFALDALIAVLAVSGVVLVVVGGLPADPARRGPAEQPAVAAEAAAQAAGGPAAPAGEPAAVESQGPPGPPATSAPPPADAGAPPPAGPAPLGPSVPVRLDIPAIGVGTDLIELGLKPDGTIAVPPLHRGAPAGWYRQLASPGEVGPAVILGHVDTARDGPAVFYRLPELRPGDTITVTRRDGSTAVFTVDQVAGYPKSAFPTEAVYGTLDHPALRLITCGGTFDRIRREYRGNVIAYATFTGTKQG
jgi:sortase (surface protein transpeptidase)